MSRPRKLEPFNESAILERLIAKEGFQDWESVWDRIREQSGEKVNRRSVFRYLKNWGLSPDSKPSSGSLSLVVAQWVQPANTVYKSTGELRARIWRLISGRGMEGFMFTTNESAEVLEMVATHLAEKLTGRKRQLRTNHKRLAEILKQKQKQKQRQKQRQSAWKIEFVSGK